jgi:hypothetical protein
MMAMLMRQRTQFARVPSKSMVACVPSQNGLFDECPQRHIAIGSGCSITRPSGAVSTTGPETMYGPSSLGVMVTSDTGDLSQAILMVLEKGSVRIRVPVRAAIAFARTGATEGTATSPTPVGDSVDSIRWISICGTERIRTIG